MVEKKKTFQRMLGLVVVITMFIGLLSPALMVVREVHAKTMSEELTSDDVWVIDDVTRYINVSDDVDYSILIRNGGTLYINNATLSLSIDQYNPHRITIKSGGSLRLWNSTIETTIRGDSTETLIRPFLKTQIAAIDGSAIHLRHDSEFKFPGWVNLDDSTIVMKNSRFIGNSEIFDQIDGLSDVLEVEDNNDCPRLTAANGSKVLIEDSVIDEYYSLPDQDNWKYQEWAPDERGLDDGTEGQSLSHMDEDDNNYYLIESGQMMEIDVWRMKEPLTQAEDYTNPTDLLKNLYIEIVYMTEEGYDGDDYLWYNGQRSDIQIEDTRGDDHEEDPYGIWEVALSELYRDGDDLYKDLTLNLTNTATNVSHNISINKLNLVSAYDNSINIWDSELIVINSHIDVDFEPAQPVLKDETVSTDKNTYMMDYNPQHRVIRLLNSSMKAYGLYPSSHGEYYEAAPDSDPIIVADEASNNRTWIYRWLTVTPMDAEGAPLANTNVTVELSTTEKEISQDLYNNVMTNMDPLNNLDAWEYINRTGMGTYDLNNEHHVTNNQGHLMMFVLSDRINHPQDWPNSRSVGPYYLNVSHPVLGNISQDISMPVFPLMNKTVSNIHEIISYDETIPLPDLMSTQEDMVFYVDDVSVGYVTVDTEVQINLTVHNNGTKDAEDIDVRFVVWQEDTDWPDDMMEIDVNNIPSIPQGENRTTTVSYTTTEEGNFYIGAYIDPDNEIIERSTEFNEVWKLLMVGEKPDLAVSYVYTTPSSPIMDGMDVSIYAGVENRGGTDVHNVSVSFSYNENGGDIHIETITVDLPGNWSFEEIGPIEWDHPGAGYYNITVEIDPDNDIEEGDHTNNDMTIPVSILTEPDLIPVNFQLSETDIHDGMQLAITTQVENINQWSSRVTQVSFYVDWGTDNQELIDVLEVPALEHEETSPILETSWIARLVDPQNLTEERQITVRVNYPMMETYEVNTANNWQNLTIDVMNPADLSIHPDDIEFSELLPQINTPVEITATVYNHGGEDVTTTVRFMDEDELIGDVSITVESQDSEEATIEWTPTIRGNREITVIVDPENEVYELNKDNNVASVIQPIFSEDYRRDLIVDDTNSPQTRGNEKRGGFVVVMEGGELFIRGSSHAIFEMDQTHDYQYSIIVMDQGKLEVNRSLIYSEHNIRIHVMDGGELNVIDDSHIYDMMEVNTYDNSTFTVTDSRIGGPLHIDGENFEFYGSTFTSTDITVHPSNIRGMNTTFNGALDDLHNTVGELTAVRTSEISMTGDSEIRIHRWWQVTTLSYGEIPMRGCEVYIEERDNADHIEQRTTNEDGMVYLRPLTDILTSVGEDPVSNYEITGTYEEKESFFQVGPTDLVLPSYPSQQHVIQTTLVFEDLRIPDLYVTDDMIEISLDNITAGDTVEISAFVGNIGHEDAEDVNVEFYLVIPDAENELIGIDTLSVPMDEYRTATVSWTAEMMDETLKEEHRTILVWIDPDMMPLSDANIVNNEAETTLVVRSPPYLEFLLDEIELQVDDVAIENNTITERDYLSIHTVFVNNGGTNLYNANLEITFEDILIHSEIIDITVDEEINITVVWEAIVSGTGDITILLNSSMEETVPSISMSRTIIIQEMQFSFANIQIPIDDQEMGEPILVSGTLERRVDGKPLGGLTVEVYLVDANNETVTSTVTSTGDDGSFNANLITPERAGEFTVWFRPVHENGRYINAGSFRVIGEERVGIPLWILLIAVIAAAGSVGGVILYLKFKGEGEWVECGACGSTIPAESTECPNCSTEFEMDTVKCSECGEWIPTESDGCPHCGAEFITTGIALEEYKETMTQQYEKFVEKHRHKAKEELGEDFTEEEFMNWWMAQPSYLSFDEWLEQEEEKRRRGGIECSECGSLNPVDEAICQKCGSSLIMAADRKKPSQEETPEEPPKVAKKAVKKPEEETSKEPPKVAKKAVKKPEETPEEEPEEKPQKVVKKVKKKPKRVAKKVKKKVKKVKSDKEE